MNTEPGTAPERRAAKAALAKRRQDAGTAMRRRLRRADAMISTLSGALVRIALLGLGLLAFAVLVREATRDTITILPFELASTAESAGLTQTGVTRWFADEMVKVGEAAESRAQEQTQVSFERLPEDFTIAATGLSVRGLIENLRYYLGNWKTISGEVSYTGKRLTLAVRVTGKASVLFQRSSEPEDLATAARTLAADAAVAILEQISPLHGAAFYFGRGPTSYADAERNIFIALRTGSREEQAAAMNLWGLIALRLKQYDAADERLARAAVLDPSLDLAVNNRGTVAEERNDLAAAVSYYRRAVEIDPRSALANGNLGRALCRQQQCDQGVRYMQAAVALEPQNPLLAINVAVGLAAAGRFEEAEQRHRENTLTYPGEPQVFRMAGRFHQDRIANLTRSPGGPNETERTEIERHLTGAARAYARAVELAPSDPQLHLELGNVFYWRAIQNRTTDVGRTLARAHDAYSQAIALDGSLGLAHYNRGVIALMREDFTGALADLRRAIELNPASREPYCAIAEVYAATGDRQPGIAARANCPTPASLR